MTDFPQQIGAYSVSRELGRGGMGVVYLARDTQLDRDVAIKALPDELAEDPERLARFEREAKTLAQLNHPNIAGIHGLEEHDGRRYLVLEFVEGQALDARLANGPLPLEDALELAVQIAAGVEAAHEAGIIHRDLKPANIMITTGGEAKVLDFGLAKGDDRQSSVATLTDSPTLMSPAQHSPTMPGVILGTAAYMSPEQARGKPLDRRTDVWSFGVVLYEMLTGASPFAGETVTDSIGAVLHKDLELEGLPTSVPQSVRRVLSRCLSRDRNERLRNVGDARLELLDALRHPVPGDAPTSAVGATSRTAIIAVALVCIVAGVILGYAVTRGRDISIAQPPVHVDFAPPSDMTVVSMGDRAGPAVVSRDGRTIVFVARPETGMQTLWIQRLSEPEPFELPGTEFAVFPFWSPDNRTVGFFTADRLKTIDTVTGFVRDLAHTPGGRGGAWNADDTILVSPDYQAPLYRVPATGGELVEVTTIDRSQHTSHRWPCFLSDGRHFLYLAVHHDASRQEGSMVFLGSLDGGPAVEIMHCDYGVEAIDDTLFFVRRGALFAIDFSLANATTSNSPKAILTNVAGDSSTWRAAFSISPAGLLVYHRSAAGEIRPAADLNQNTAMEGHGCNIVKRGGRLSRTIAAGAPQNSANLSPDGKLLALSTARLDQDDFDVWIFNTHYGEDRTGDADTSDLKTNVPERLTIESGVEIAPIFSPDGSEIVFGRLYADVEGLFRKRIGGGREELLLASEPSETNADNLMPSHWSRDGQFLFFSRGSWNLSMYGKNGCWVLPLDGGDPYPLFDGTESTRGAVLSPNGRWLAYSERSGQDPWEVHVVPFAPGWSESETAPPAESRWRVSLADGSRPRWSDAGDELFYLTETGTLIAVQVDTESAVFTHDSGTVLFQAYAQPGAVFDVFPDSTTFVINSWFTTDPKPVSAVLNWRGLLESRE